MNMRTFSLFLVSAIMLATAVVQAQDKKPPEKLTFSTKNGNVIFDHSAHIKRANGDCKTCHDKLFPQDAKAPLNFKAGLHKPAENNQTSCGACHRPGGAAFETKGNCAKCHVKG